MHNAKKLLLELDKLKSVYRRSYLTDSSRNENSAEHSWHLAMALLALREMMPTEINIDHAIRIALAHNVCEIGPGDISVHSPLRGQKAKEERAYIEKFAAEHQGFAFEIKELWLEYEEKKTLESRWVEVVDGFLPFLMNLATEGLLWREQEVKKSQILKVNSPIAKTAPAIYAWLEEVVEKAIVSGWINDD